MGVPREWVTRATDARRAWVKIPGASLAGAAAPVSHMRGVYAGAGLERVYTQREAMRRLVGVVDARDSAGGRARAARSTRCCAAGAASRASPAIRAAPASTRRTTSRPCPGDAVVLTINQALQEISERALADAMVRRPAPMAATS